MAKKKFLILIGVALFAFILLNLNLRELLAILSKANPLLFIFALVLAALTGIFKGVKWKQIIRAHNSDFPLLKCIKVFFIGYFISIFTPARIGDFARAFYLQKSTKSLGKALSTIFMDRLIDVGILFAFACIAIIAFALLFDVVVIPLNALFAVIAVFVVAVMLFLRKNFVGRIVRPFYNMLAPQKHKEKLKLSFHDFYDSFSEAVRKRRKLIAFAVAIALFDWLISISFAYMLIFSLNLQVPIAFMFLLVPIASLLDLLPISISGIGTRDAAFIFLFGFYSISAETAVAYSLLFLFAGYWFSALIGALLFTTEPIKFSLSEIDG